VTKHMILALSGGYCLGIGVWRGIDHLWHQRLLVEMAQKYDFQKEDVREMQRVINEKFREKV